MIPKINPWQINIGNISIYFVVLPINIVASVDDGLATPAGPVAPVNPVAPVGPVGP